MYFHDLKVLCLKSVTYTGKTGYFEKGRKIMEKGEMLGKAFKFTCAMSLKVYFTV